MKIKYAINLHKGLTFIVVLSLMAAYNNFTLAALIYLALHGGYGILWLLKDKFYPDKQWEQDFPVATVIVTFFIICLYWIAPFILISSNLQPSPVVISAAVLINLLGIFLHYGSDAQKYYTLKYKTGLITEGFLGASQLSAEYKCL